MSPTIEAWQKPYNKCHFKSVMQPRRHIKRKKEDVTSYYTHMGSNHGLLER